MGNYLIYISSTLSEKIMFSEIERESGVSKLESKIDTERGTAKSENKIALDVTRFVKHVLPYGSNNRGEDRCRRQDISPQKVDPQFLKMYNELSDRMGKYTPVQNLHHILIQAETAIKYGVGNCEQQSAIAFVALLAKNVFDVSRIAVSKRNQGEHVFIEFIDPDSKESFALDPWDDNTIYSITKRRNSGLSLHTQMRAWPREISSSRGAGFSFNQFNELLEIKSLACLTAEKIKPEDAGKEFIVCTDAEKEYLYNCKQVSEFFRKFLLKCIYNSTVLDDHEKLEAVKKLGGSILEWENLSTKNRNRLLIGVGIFTITIGSELVGIEAALTHGGKAATGILKKIDSETQLGIATVAIAAPILIMILGALIFKYYKSPQLDPSSCDQIRSSHISSSSS